MMRIAMSKPMVLALLDGGKTCTRRLVSRQNSLVDGSTCPAEVWNLLDWSKAWVDSGPSPAGNPGPYYKVPKPFDQDGAEIDTVHRVYPRIRPGDVLEVAEATRRGVDGAAEYDADGAGTILGGNELETGAWLKPDGSPYRVSRLSARYMPSAWCRLRLRVTDVRPSTPGEVWTAEEARAEGLTYVTGWVAPHGERGAWDGWTWRGMDDRLFGTPAHAFEALWRSLHDDWTPTAPCWRIGFEIIKG